MKNNKNKSFILGSVFFISCFLIVFPAYPGTYCGSSSGVGKLYKDNSSDWWPDLRLNLIVGIVEPISATSATFCAATQGQAYFGSGCVWHDDCYDGKVGLGMNKAECDKELLNQWRQACNSKYKPANSLDIGQEACREYCETTAEGMYHALTTSPEAWNNAQAERDSNIVAAINAIYLEIFGRIATDEEQNSSRSYLASTKSVDGLKEKVKQDYAGITASLNPVMQFLLK